MKMSCSLECGFWDTRATNTYALTILGSSGAWRRVSRVAPAIQCRSRAQHWHRDCMPHLPPSLHTWLITNHRTAQCRPTSRPDPHSVSLSDHQQHSLTRLHNSRLKCRFFILKVLTLLIWNYNTRCRAKSNATSLLRPANQFWGWNPKTHIPSCSVDISNKIGCHGNIPWGIEKLISDLSSTAIILPTVKYGKAFVWQESLNIKK